MRPVFGIEGDSPDCHPGSGSAGETSHRSQRRAYPVAGPPDPQRVSVAGSGAVGIGPDNDHVGMLGGPIHTSVDQRLDLADIRRIGEAAAGCRRAAQ